MDFIETFGMVVSKITDISSSIAPKQRLESFSLELPSIFNDGQFITNDKPV